MLTGNKGKAIIIDPDTGEQLPVRKVRGSKAGGWIELCGPAAPLVVVAGEGIETVLAVRHAMMSCNLDLSTTAFWSLIDLGNIGGAAKASISTRPHAMLPGGRAVFQVRTLTDSLRGLPASVTTSCCLATAIPTR